VVEHYHALVWIDHQEARIFQFNATEVDSTMVAALIRTNIFITRRMLLAVVMPRWDEEFLERVTQALMHAGAILITGPASAKQELAAHIQRQHPDVATRISGGETLDHPSDGELVALARRFFRADDRMRRHPRECTRRLAGITRGAQLR
jgi:stalled ribosome rescue protein Dom34